MNARRNFSMTDWFTFGLYRFALLHNARTLHQGQTFPMKFHTLLLVLAPAIVLSVHAEDLKSVDDFKAAADKANAVLTIPDWEQTPEAVDGMVKNAIATANKALDQIGSQDLSKVT